MRAVDYSFSRPSLTALRAAGYDGIIRYLSWDAAKNLTRPEVDAAHAAGLWVALNWEGWGDLREFGATVAAAASNGRTAGAEARRLCDAMAAPAGLPIFVSADYPAQPEHYEIIGAFLDAFAAASARPVGIYGGGPLIDWCLDHGHAALGWQTNATSWGVTDRAVIRQALAPESGPFAGQIDPNTVTGDYRSFAWTADFHPAPPGQPEEDDMPMVYVHEVPTDGAVHAVPVPPPHAGAAGWGDVWVSLIAASGDLKATAQVWAVAAVGSGFVALPGLAAELPVGAARRVVAKLVPGTEAVMVAVKGGPAVSVMVEATVAR